MNRRRTARLAGLLALATTAGLGSAAPSFAAEQAVGLTTQTPSQIVSFGVDAPGTVTGPTPITFPVGATDLDLIGLDYRPRGGGLYAQGENGTLYVLAPPAMMGANWTATAVNTTPLVDPTGGTTFGFDFNPVPDAIRVVNDADENFRFSPNNGNVISGPATVPAEGSLDYPAGDPNGAANPNVAAVGYTNSFDGATATTLFDIDAGLDIVATQNPPNNGQLNTLPGGGALGVNTTANAGLDIAQASGTAYAALELASMTGSSGLYRINLVTGAASPFGAIGGGQPLEGLAVAPASVIQFAQAATSISEGGGTANVTVQRAGALNRQVTVDYATSMGGAGTLTFAPNDASETIAVPIMDDQVDEPDQNVTLSLNNPGPNAIVGAQSSATLMIVDDDDPGAEGAPDALVSVPSKTAKKVARSGKLAVRFSCTERCFASSILMLGGRAVGQGAAQLDQPGVQTLVVNLTRDGRGALRRRIRRGGRINAMLASVFSDAAGNSSRLTTAFRLPR